ncbi:hypothetical protein KMC57_gp10 [Achromobacter phage vB_AxyP_19-32_Axy24]|uniref:Uncharacterized protein n=4 Tax=Dongdastvirus TaxID=2842653 RepID=A0A514CUJ8_9CAUD|nr:hypothetical protein ADP65_00008 [Achromobacter phage phiAxp-3]YP_010078978.1 hypothetical protein KMC55_gp10 [Achromobacter phage vB_AxyP_19-32_Axy04]YP_010079058.1 hypothetical protein KMC56_gp10 [Achromobacter phage vB_AxyP_19-32_Axy12]YP_010079140.1 hypothetical protein KMC57_gp10 [Achromobacter phage vB_AxyP_19-32_Axy24]ALA45477.1 hypothetical protein ADP65_00008 [Achromobacter phage phiAxp-3]QDH83799.1 hypothetical protein Axy04_010 [Achromobacter phage vB_AxyP_19-32_Axy04]QDH84149.1
MLNHNPILFVLGYILVAIIVIAVEPLRDFVLLAAQVLAAVAFLAFIAAITLEAIQSRKRHE